MNVAKNGFNRLPFDIETAKAMNLAEPFDFNAVDARPGGTLAAPEYQGFKLLLCPLSDDFDGAVSCVTHPTGCAKSLRSLHCGRAEIDTLYTATYADSCMFDWTGRIARHGLALSVAQ